MYGWPVVASVYAADVMVRRGVYLPCAMALKLNATVAEFALERAKLPVWVYWAP